MSWSRNMPSVDFIVIPWYACRYNRWEKLTTQAWNCLFLSEVNSWSVPCTMNINHTAVSSTLKRCMPVCIMHKSHWVLCTCFMLLAHASVYSTSYSCVTTTIATTIVILYSKCKMHYEEYNTPSLPGQLCSVVEFWNQDIPANKKLCIHASAS